MLAGLFRSKPASPFTVVPYGVLGTDSSGSSRAPEPDSDCVFVDPASLTIVNTGWPSDAGGASGSIYRFLGIDAAFPDDVKAAVNAQGDAAYHRYGFPESLHCVHCAGIDFRREGAPATFDAAASALSVAYAHVLELAATLSKRRLRLLPISSGIFAGRFAERMPELTAVALLGALDQLPEASQKTLKGGMAIELCVFNAADAPAFKAALEAQLKRK